ncbi:Spo0E family sporulation regulatory protein-aspartic acid phosphatase [Bacillus hwajinpoensis]|uniref:Spo0E family sporulation regulatory protein-aspartic acid phosphatase n=1 Tax=Guptibacillus hwajinpoensis TaxID=208199 RepID=A0A845F2M6_9BACL|nr:MULTISPECIES: aspartyl-phosphate phosphatase Spo0E family protein [Bacillaceae]MYL65008.1 Spo0E family sporulation regulatory protein-aspartic acid phosphatase [Pseudalkalibacillus hwajinpoensis]PFG12075.1 Spo0E like sporulation regulatory protein [Bacillus sp. es.036]QHA90893.1 Spo0E family sporulation regulatory protein-aspartic acid phosphatase [Bacillus sp. N1-1]
MKLPIQCYTRSNLLALIDQKKVVLTSKVLAHGFTHKQTVMASQELDKLLNRYQFGQYEGSQSRYLA